MFKMMKKGNGLIVKKPPDDYKHFCFSLFSTSLAAAKTKQTMEILYLFTTLYVSL